MSSWTGLVKTQDVSHRRARAGRDADVSGARPDRRRRPGCARVSRVLGHRRTARIFASGIVGDRAGGRTHGCSATWADGGRPARGPVESGPGCDDDPLFIFDDRRALRLGVIRVARAPPIHHGSSELIAIGVLRPSPVRRRSPARGVHAPDVVARRATTGSPARLTRSAAQFASAETPSTSCTPSTETPSPCACVPPGRPPGPLSPLGAARSLPYAAVRSEQVGDHAARPRRDASQPYMA